MARTNSPSRIGVDPAAPAIGGVRRQPVLLNLLLSLRPAQWTKNLLVFAGLLFGQRLRDPAAVTAAVAAFVIFCALSGVVYLVNDIVDRESDREHPLKSRRPIASGALPIAVATMAAALLGAGAIAASAALGERFAAVAIAYVVLMALYSGVLKHIVIVD